jgi:hypothetical protein
LPSFLPVILDDSSAIAGSEGLAQIEYSYQRPGQSPKALLELLNRGINTMTKDPEALRLQEARSGKAPWKMWGPYLSERQWGTVREDYSDNGDAWSYFSHDQARSRAYHWGEDGLAGLSDDKQRLCFALALWNGKDSILKERLFGLTNNEGNHGEDVKEYYYYLDSTPTHSYMKYLYKYPQASYPYDDLVRTNRERNKLEPEYELIDTGIFDQDRYFDVFVEYAKLAPEDILVQISVCNRGPDPSDIHVLPTLWFRNTWTWQSVLSMPALDRIPARPGVSAVTANHFTLGRYYWYAEGEVPVLFTDNETNSERIFGKPNPTPFVKDGINDYVVLGQQDAVNPAATGSKASAHYTLNIGPGATAVIRLRLTNVNLVSTCDPFGSRFGRVFDERRREADAFYRGIIPATLSPDAAMVMRQALAGMLWSKQYYFFDLNWWLEEHGAAALKPAVRQIRNSAWGHMINEQIVSMPDKWEYPWYASWDLAFHAIALSTVDIDFAKDQLDLMLQPFYQHPTGQIPAYEWNFGDANPPVHAWAAIFLYRTEQALHGEGDIEFLEHAYGKLMLNFGWWVNRLDRHGRNLFEGGFLGLDNIGVFDRNAPLPTGGYLEQADSTAWVCLFCQSMLEIGIELAAHDPVYQDLTATFVDQFLWIAHAMNHIGGDGMWDEEDGFYYDILRLPDGSATRLKVRSIVGLLPMCATTAIEAWQRQRIPRLLEVIGERVRQKPELLNTIHPTGPGHFGVADRGIVALVDQKKLRRILSRMLDENEFLSPYGIRALSRYHLDHPFVFSVQGREYKVQYLPAESDTAMFGGNSNWRGPIWAPLNAILIRALMQFYTYYGDDFKVECPTGSGNWMTLFEVSKELADRLARIFLVNDSGRRPVFGGAKKLQTDPNWRDYLLFYEYFHGDNGAGIGASHQTGWTGLVAKMFEIFGQLDPKRLLQEGRRALFTQPEEKPEESLVS